MVYIFGRVLKILITSVIILAVIALIAADTELIYFRNIDIDVLLNNKMPTKALKGPAYAEGQHSELLLKEEYKTLSATECASLTDEERLTVINKWGNEIYPYFDTFMLASLIDSVPYYIVDELGSTDMHENDIPGKISEWSASSLLHTQSLQAFREQPGNDPWGLINIVNPAYKKLLPSDMIAESIYSGKMSGKCESLAALNTVLFTAMGVTPENVLLLRQKSHVLGLVRYGGTYYLIDNKKIEPVTEDIRYYLAQIKFIRYITYSSSVDVKFSLTDAFFNNPGSLQQAIADLTRTGEGLCKAEKVFKETDTRSRESIYRRIFSHVEEENINKLFTLTRYAYQSLYVSDTDLYLEASIRAPVTKALAKRLHTRDDIFKWISDNVVCAPIYEDYKDRIMIADQVIVFGKGTVKDQALLACALLCSIGENPVLKITNNSAYIELNSRLYDARTWNETDMASEQVILEIKAR